VIIWTGWGVVVAFIGAICLGVTGSVVDAAAGDYEYHRKYRWPTLVAFWVAAGITWPIGRGMNKSDENWRYDPETNKYVVTRTSGTHTFFFIPVEYWGPIYFVLGVIYGLVGLVE
jgi:hypothetical protein